MEFIIYIILAVIAGLFFIAYLAGVFLLFWKFSAHLNDAKIRRAGEYGEAVATDRIKSCLSPEDRLLTNVEIELDGRRAEFDDIIINKYGVFIIEVKNYVGELFGGENDATWEKGKTTDAGNTYYDTVKNPIPQVKREIYLLSQYLECHGERVWVEGFAYLVDNESPVESRYVIADMNDMYVKTHTVSKNPLSQAKVERICQLLANSEGYTKGA